MDPVDLFHVDRGDFLDLILADRADSDIVIQPYIEDDFTDASRITPLESIQLIRIDDLLQ